MFEQATLNPSDSASQQSARSFEPGLSGPDSVSSVFEFLRVVTEAHSAGTLGWSSDQTFTVVNDAMKVLGNDVGRRSAELRVTNGPGASGLSRSSGSGKSASVSSGGSRSRLEKIRSVGSWRPTNVPDGLCYTKMLRVGDASSSVANLGKWPTVASLLRTSNSAFKSVADLERFRVTGDVDAVHVLAGGLEGVPLLPVIARVAQGMKTAPGTFGAVLRASAIPFSGSSLRLSARTCMGGEGAENKGDDHLLLAECCRLVSVKEERAKVGDWIFASVPRKFVSRSFNVVGRSGRVVEIGLAVEGDRFQGFLLPDGSIKIPVGCQRELNATMRGLLATSGPVQYYSDRL